MTETNTARPLEKKAGHAADTQAADEQRGMPGRIDRPIKLTFLGAGSSFCHRLCRDLLMIPDADHGEIALVDTDTERLETVHALIDKVIAKAGRSDGWTVTASTDRRKVSHLLARYAGVSYDEMAWECAGINHLAWFTRLEHNGENLYTRVLYEKFRDEVAEGIREAEAGLARHDACDVPEDRDAPGLKNYKQDDLIRKDMCVHFGAFVTESSGHLSEYLPYYRKSPTGRKLLRLWTDGGSRFYATNWPNWRNVTDEQRRKMLAGETWMEDKRSWEYASWIIEACEKNQPYRFHGNVLNCPARGGGPLIGNLMRDSCVEVACLVDRNGIQPTAYGDLPPQMAAICRSNQAVFDLAATAAIEMSREAAVHALMLDPLCAAVCTPGEIRQMAEEMFEAEALFLEGYK